MRILVRGCVDCGKTLADSCEGYGAKVRIGEGIGTIVVGN